MEKTTTEHWMHIKSLCKLYLTCGSKNSSKKINPTLHQTFRSSMEVVREACNNGLDVAEALPPTSQFG